jgi:hypothetical protein
MRLYFTDDLLDQVLNRHDAFHSAVLIHNDAEVRLSILRSRTALLSAPYLE